jgi:hypothetical protein
MGALELGESGWREAGWAEATEPQSEAGNDRGQAPQAIEVTEGVTRKLPKIEVKWNEVHQALEAWQEASTTVCYGQRKRERRETSPNRVFSGICYKPANTGT